MEQVGAAILIAGSVVFILWTPDEPLPSAFRAAVPVGTAPQRLRVSPRQYRDFGWAWLTPAPARRTEALPAAADRAKVLGLINIAYNLPLVVGRLIAGVVLGLMNSYPALSAMAGVAPLAAAVTVTRAGLTA